MQSPDFLSWGTAASRAATPVQVPPPPHFRPVQGRISHAQTNSNNPFRNVEGYTASQRIGIRYERKVQTLLQERFAYYKPQPLFHFRDESGSRTCIPDGLLVPGPLVLLGCVAIFEIKHQHVPEAWWQLRRLYEPVARYLYPQASRFICVEICRVMDAATPFPEVVEQVEDLEQFLSAAPDGTFGVYRCRM